MLLDISWISHTSCARQYAPLALKTPPQNTYKNLSTSLSRNGKYVQLVTLYIQISVLSKHISDVSCHLFILQLSS